MSNLLGIFSKISDFFEKIGSAIYYIIIAIGIVICIVIMAKHPASRRLLFYIISAVLICTGVFSSIKFFKEINMQGYINGELQLINSIHMDNFNYSTNSIVFTYDEDAEIYSYENNFSVCKFDGEHKYYNIEFNDYILFNAKITAGAIYAVVNMDFRDTDGEIVDSGDMDIIIKYFSNKTNLKLTCKDEAHSNYLERYFKDYGFKIKVYEREN